jgi:hypothetical protein
MRGFFGSNLVEAVAASNENGDEGGTGSPGVMYAPKCLVIVSRVDYFSTFKVGFRLLCLFIL